MEQVRLNAKAVETEAEFNALLPQLASAMQSNQQEWEYYHTMQGLLEIMNANRHMLFYAGTAEQPSVLAFFQVNRYATGEAQVELIWSWARGDLQIQVILDAAYAVAAAAGARRLCANACRPLARGLMQKGFEVRNFDMIKDI